MNEITIINLIQWFITIILFGISLFYTWYSNRVRGSEFVVPEVHLDERRIFIQQDGPIREQVRIKTIIQNIGDRAGYLKIETVKLIVKKDTASFEGQFFRTSRGLEFVLSEGVSSGKPKPIVLLVGKNQVNFREKAFDFILPEKTPGDWTEAILKLEGAYLTHKKKMKPFRERLQVKIGDYRFVEDVIERQIMRTPPEDRE